MGKKYGDFTIMRILFISGSFSAYSTEHTGESLLPVKAVIR